MRDEIEIREYERQQLQQFLPELVDLYEERGMDERADRFEYLIDVFDEPHDEEPNETYQLGSDQWDELATALDEVGDQRASWLSAKIARRAELKTHKMGFTTSIPIMAMVTGKKPERPG